MLPVKPIDTADARIELGGVVFELRHRGGAHTPGDMLVWLPEKDVLFTGDIVYVDRLLAILPVSNTRSWLKSFVEVERLTPSRIVPGHGGITTLATARAQTRDYLLAMRRHMADAVERGVDLTAAVRSFRPGEVESLRLAPDLISGNAKRVYLELERE